MSDDRQKSRDKRRASANSPETRAAIIAWAVRMKEASEGFEHSGVYAGMEIPEEDRGMLR